jgi:two-component sensor histidine kinase/CheY-like chemotaxis protein
VEDNEAHAEIVRRAFEGLQALFQLRVAASLKEARALLTTEPFDLIISDWNLPDGQGIEFLPAHSESLQCAVLLMTSQGTEQMAVRAMKSGSADYVVKSEITLGEMPQLAERALREWDHRVAQSRAEVAIRESLHEKEAMLREIHHRVKNNLQIISSLLQLQANEIDDPRILEVFEASKARVRSMSLVHEMLYQSESLARIDLATYFSGLAKSLLDSCCKSSLRPRLEVRVSAGAVSIDTAIPLGLIANELITNSLKYAFPDGRAGTVQVTCEILPDGDRLFSINDDGVGLLPGAVFENCSSLGLKLVGMFTRKLRGQGTWRREGGGLGYSLRFREQSPRRSEA